MEWRRGEYVLSDERERMDAEAVRSMLRATYWAAERSLDDVEKTIANSLCFGVFRDGRQVAFARVVTDEVTFAWISDVVVDLEERGRGLGIWMMEVLLEHPRVPRRLRVLGTRDAHALYERLGFKRAPEGKYLDMIDAASDWMVPSPTDG